MTTEIQDRLTHFHRHRLAAEKALTALGEALAELNEAKHYAACRTEFDPQDKTRTILSLEFRYVDAEEPTQIGQIIAPPGEYADGPVLTGAKREPG